MHGRCEGGAQLGFFSLRQMSAQHVQLVGNTCVSVLSDETQAWSVLPHLDFFVGRHGDGILMFAVLEQTQEVLACWFISFGFLGLKTESNKSWRTTISTRLRSSVTSFLDLSLMLEDETIGPLAD